jgi:hypothetical protein
MLAESLAVRAQEPAPALRIETDHLVKGDGSKFLIFVSFFDALRAYDRNPSSLRSDFQYLRAHQIDGVRVFPNWQFGNNLFYSNGTLDTGRLAVLRAILQMAYEEGLVVDVSFARFNMQVPEYKAALVSAASELRDFRHLVFDIENERDLDRPDQFLSLEDTQDARNRIKGVDPSRIVTASNTGVSGEDGVGTAAMQINLALDLAAFHDPRYADWYAWRTPWIIQNMWYYWPWNVRVYLQEPQAWQDDPNENHHLQALHNSKRYGAAAWTFHTRAGHDLGSQSFYDRLSVGERVFFDRVRDELPIEGWSACNFGTSLSSLDVPSGGGYFSVYLDTRWGCSWNAFRADGAATWLQLTSPAAGVGSSIIYFRVDPNGGGYRETKLVVGTVPITIRQQ